jgi:hypothetical protein
VYVVFKATPEPDTSVIFISEDRSIQEQHFHPVQVDLIGDSLSRFPVVTVDDAGNPIVAFMKFD